MTTRTFEYGTHKYSYELIKQDRKTLSLTVEPCMNIVLKAPKNADNKKIEDFLRRKWMWLNKQLNFFERYQAKSYDKEFVSGESFYYLGRQYRLLVEAGPKDKVSLSKGKLSIATTKRVDDGQHNKKLLHRWYRKRRDKVFKERYSEVLTKFNYRNTPELTVRVMPKRWGSFVKGEKVVLNPLLIQVSKEAIDYVITHELCHMKYKNHDYKFYDFLESKYPNWKKTKERMELQSVTTI